MTCWRRVWVTGFLGWCLVLGIAGCGGSQPAPGPDSPSTGGPASPTASRAPGPGTRGLTMAWAGKERTYTVHAPPGYRPTQPTPIVIVMHDRGGSANTMQQMTGLDAQADRFGFLVVYLDGVNGAFNALVCCGDEDDVGYVRALVAQLTRDWHADPDRVYLTGISNGGDMTFRLAVEVPGTFAAIAPVSGGFIGTRASSDATFAPKTPVSVITFIGAQDRFAASFTDGIQTWRSRIRCPPPASQAFNGGQVTRTTTQCPDGSEVVAYTVELMGHAWPGGGPVGLGDPNAPINATDLMWQFFADHPRRR
jgi:polyhydroxybutyrate depolymerase